MKHIKLYEKKGRYFKKDEIENWFWSFQTHHMRDSRFEEVKLLIDEGINVNLKDNVGNTALYHAVNNDKAQPRFVKILLDNGAKVNLEMESCTPIYFSKHAEITQMLIDAGADVNVKNKYGNTPLSRAVRMDDDDNINTLIDAGSILDGDLINYLINRTHTGETDKIITKLLNKGVSLENVEPYHMEIFLSHIDSGTEDVIESILENKPDYIFKLIDEGIKVSDKLREKYAYVFDSDELGLL